MEEMVLLRRAEHSGMQVDSNKLHLREKNTYKQKPRCTQLIIADGLKCATLLHNMFQQCSILFTRSNT